jgi:hypothetical protein
MKHMAQGGYAGFRDSAFEKSDPDGGHRTGKHHGIRKFPSFEGYLGRKHVTLGINLFRLEGRKSIYHELDGLVYFESFGHQELWGRPIMLHRGWTSLRDFLQKNQRNDVIGHDAIASKPKYSELNQECRQKILEPLALVLSPKLNQFHISRQRSFYISNLNHY